jgi:hypothetical protein
MLAHLQPPKVAQFSARTKAFGKAMPAPLGQETDFVTLLHTAREIANKKMKGAIFPRFDLMKI